MAISRERTARRSRAALTRAAAGGRPEIRSIGGRPREGWLTLGSLARRYDGRVTTPTPASEPGDRRPLLERPPGDRYVVPTPPTETTARRLDAILVPVGLVLGTAVAFVIAGGLLTFTAGLVVLAAFLGWLTGRLVSPPARAAFVALVAIAVGFLGIWLFGRIEGGVLNPIDYLVDVEGPLVVILSLVFGSGLAAGSSR